jgi:hypothetical protein
LHYQDSFDISIELLVEECLTLFLQNILISKMILDRSLFVVCIDSKRSLRDGKVIISVS